MDIQSSFTSSSDPRWRSFVLTVISALVFLMFASYAFILVMDPYDNLRFSPTMERVPVDKYQRLFHPALARKAHFDSAIIGNSNIRLLKPQQLNRLLDSTFVNLGMDAASSWEQQQIFDVFVRNHNKINNIILGLDYLWCYPVYADQKFVGDNTEAGFPYWLFDARVDNDLPPLSLLSLQHAWLQLLAVTGVRPSPYGADGYHLFTGPMTNYDLQKARINIYGSITPKDKIGINPPETVTAKQRKALRSRALERLAEMLIQLPSETRKIIMFTPYHYYYQAAPGSRQEIIWQECKNYVVELAERLENAFVIDFMIESEITTNDANYWDYKHYNEQIAALLGRLIAQVTDGELPDRRYQLLFSSKK